MTTFSPIDPGFSERVRRSFGDQKIMSLIGAELSRVSPGEVEIQLGFRPDLTQQNGYLHAGIVATILDSACGYAAYTLMRAEAQVLTVEYKINLLSPAAGSLFLARGRVTRPGRTLTVCVGDVVSVDADSGVEKPVATMLATMMAVEGHPLYPTL